MFGGDVSLVLDTEAKCPLFSRLYILFGLDIGVGSETQKGRVAERRIMAEFLKSTWHGHSGRPNHR